MNEKIELVEKIPKPKKMGGAGFHVMLMLTMVKDVLDFIETITIILWIVSAVSSVVIAIVIWLYYFINNVSFIDRYGSKKLVYYVLFTLIEITPFSFLPFSTLTLILIRQVENHDRLKKFIRSIAEIENPANFAKIINSAALSMSVSRTKAMAYANDNIQVSEDKKEAA